MKRMVLPLGALLFVIACGDDSASANYQWAEGTSSSSEVASSSSSEKVSSSSTPIEDLSSSSSETVILSSSSSRHSGPDPESSSSFVASSSSIAVSSSSVVLSSSSAEISSSSEVASSSSEILTDPSKIFEIRKPKDHVLPCEIPWGDEVQRDTLSQHDVICTYDYNGEKGFLYVQLTPNSCDGGMSITPGGYNVDNAEFYVNGKFAEVSDVNYEWGGNHHVEKLSFTYKGNVFRYAQSTMGWGGRPCQKMDCMKVFESDGKTSVENGCNERSLPIVCRNVNLEGEVSDFTDDYKICEGDPRTLGYDVEY